MRWLSRAAAVLLVVPGAAAAQDQAPFPDRWLSIEEISGVLGLSAEQRASVEAPFAEVNGVLQRATQRRAELLVEFQGKPRYSQMSADERRATEERLLVIRADYEGRQAELEQWLGAIRAQLSTAQQARFDALSKPRITPAPQAAAGNP